MHQLQSRMGGLKHLQPQGGYSTRALYKTDEVVTKYGITAKVLSKIDGLKGHDGLPMTSNTSTYYMKRDDKGRIEQIRIYSKRMGIIDLDWGHQHKDKPVGVVHVHHYKYDSRGIPMRDTSPRYMNNAELRKFGKFIKYVAPHAKLRK